MAIKRYDWNAAGSDVWMGESADGDYIQFEDFRRVYDMLHELAGEVFGHGLGSEPDVYKDYDHLQELQNRTLKILAETRP